MTLKIDLPEEESLLLDAKAKADGISAEECARGLLTRALEAARKPLSARIRQIWADIPDEVRSKLPADGASEHDHYIYGVPKKNSGE